MRKCQLFVSLAVSVLFVIGFTTCKSPANSSGGKTLTGLEITEPDNTGYTEGAVFDKTGLVVTATYSNKVPANVTGNCTYEPDLDTPLTIDDTVIVISYTEDGFTLKASLGITVYPEGVTPPAGPPVVTGVTVSPATATVAKGGNRQFNASVLGTNNPAQTVTWTVDGASAAGTTVTNGLLTVAADETAATLTVKAASTVAGDKFGTATVTIPQGQGQGPEVTTVTSVAVTPPTATAAKGETVQFNASVLGTNNPAQTVTWTVDGASAAGTTVTNGSLTVAADETATSLTVRAASAVDGYTDISGAAVVTIASPPAQGAVVVVPATVTVRRGETFQFSVTIAGVTASNNDVVWEIPDDPWSPPTNISPSGLLTASAADGSAGFTVKATSKADPSISGTATVTLTF